MMCEWKAVRDSRPDSDREVLIYMENDRAVYFGFCERQDDKTDGAIPHETYQWYFHLEGDWHEIEEKKVLCYLEYPDIDVVGLDIPIHNGGAS